MEDRDYLLMGLGNPEEKYKNTRHNIGYRCYDEISFIESLNYWRSPNSMNESGRGLDAVLMEHSQCCNMKTDSLIVIHDDIYLAFGIIRIKFGGGDGGHKGIGSNYIRIRFGVGKGKNIIDHVLSDFTKEEEKEIPKLIEQTQTIVEFIIEKGVEAAMNRFNRKIS